MPRVPDRWFNYSPYGGVVANRFVAMKVPLKEMYNVSKVSKFTPDDALRQLPLALVIDLTDTLRYYDPREFEKQGVMYAKMRVRGKLVPEYETVCGFIQVVNEFLEANKNDDGLIAVHCTHGVNRTGYMVCAYMILEMGYTPEEAIRTFDTQRGHSMERENYLSSLRSMVPSAGTCYSPNDMFLPTNDCAVYGHNGNDNRSECFDQYDLPQQQNLRSNGSTGYVRKHNHHQQQHQQHQQQKHQQQNRQHHQPKHQQQNRQRHQPKQHQSHHQKHHQKQRHQQQHHQQNQQHHQQQHHQKHHQHSSSKLRVNKLQDALRNESNPTISAQIRPQLAAAALVLAQDKHARRVRGRLAYQERAREARNNRNSNS